MKTIVYCDMDGVVADFIAGFKDFFKVTPVGLDQFTTQQYCFQQPRFFAFLPEIPEGVELVRKLAEKHKVVFLTTPMEGMHFCKLDKIEWVREHFGSEFDVIFSDNKAEFVDDSTSILIDDYDKNLKSWKDAGGTAIPFPSENILAQVESALDPKRKKISVKVETPTPEQAKAGNYLKGKISLNGLDIRIENVPGSIRSGIGENGRKWFSRQHCYYGYVVGVLGNDGDPIDIFINPEGVNRTLAFVINQNINGLYDEAKIILGYDSEEEAVLAYLENYEKGWERNIGSVVRTNTRRLREWFQTKSPSEPFTHDKKDNQ